MSDLSSSETRKLERLFRMSGGYMLEFSNRTVSDFIEENVRGDIDDSHQCADRDAATDRRERDHGPTAIRCEPARRWQVELWRAPSIRSLMPRWRR